MNDYEVMGRIGKGVFELVSKYSKKDVNYIKIDHSLEKNLGFSRPGVIGLLVDLEWIYTIDISDDWTKMVGPNIKVGDVVKYIKGKV